MFLRQFYLDEDTLAGDFRTKNADHVSAVFRAYPRLCAAVSDESFRAKCLIGKLADRNGVTYAFVRYDEGYRCEVPGNINNETLSKKSKCARYKHAP